jgi:tellurite resistance protein
MGLTAVFIAEADGLLEPLGEENYMQPATTLS